MKSMLKIAAMLISALFCTANIFSQSRPIIYKLSAIAKQDKTIEISWLFPKKPIPKITGIKLYRSAKPFSSYKEIEGKTPIATCSGTSFVDTVPEHGEYFYAVITVTSEGDYKTLIPGLNATTKGAKIKVPISEVEEKIEPTVEKKESQPQQLVEEVETLPLRAIPLPNPSNILGFDNDKTEFSAEALNNVQGLGEAKSEKARPIANPYFFEEDMFSPDGGDEYLLFQALRSGLVVRKYKESVDLISDFLSVNREKAATDRAEFYLGESYYFCKDYKKAINCFLQVQEEFPELTKKWIDSSLDLLEVDY